MQDDTKRHRITKAPTGSPQAGPVTVKTLDGRYVRTEQAWPADKADSPGRSIEAFGFTRWSSHAPSGDAEWDVDANKKASDTAREELHA